MTADQWIEICKVLALIDIALALLFLAMKKPRAKHCCDVSCPRCRACEEQPSADYYMTLTGKLIDLRTAAERHASEPDQAHQLPGCEPPTEAVRSQRPHE